MGFRIWYVVFLLLIIIFYSRYYLLDKFYIYYFQKIAYILVMLELNYVWIVLLLLTFSFKNNLFKNTKN